MEYRHISQAEAARIMAADPSCLILDVRRPDEFAGGHIPGAVCVPNETIGAAEIPALPDKGRRILVYCRTGRRSRQAAAKLAAKGYADILDFGGIITWRGPIER